MKKLLSLVIPVFFGLISYGQQYVKFQSYVQIRLSSDFDSLYSGEMRRLKFYLRNGKNFYPNWAYFISAGVYQRSKERLIIHDIRLCYQYKNLKIYTGQFIPAFSIQRSQSDWQMPVLERARAVGYLQPNGTIGVRDLGIQAEITSRKKQLKLRLGIFNGRGTKQWSLKNTNFLASANIQYQDSLYKLHYLIGTSYMFRKAQNLPLPEIIPDTMLFSGADRRYDIYAMVEYNGISLQSEFIHARLNDFSMQGYYFLATARLKKFQSVISYENFANAVYPCHNCKKLSIGINYFADKNYFRISNFINFDVDKKNFSGLQFIFQLQIFLIR